MSDKKEPSEEKQEKVPSPLEVAREHLNNAKTIVIELVGKEKFEALLGSHGSDNCPCWTDVLLGKLDELRTTVKTD